MMLMLLGKHIGRKGSPRQAGSREYSANGGGGKVCLFSDWLVMRFEFRMVACIYLASSSLYRLFRRVFLPLFVATHLIAFLHVCCSFAALTNSLPSFFANLSFPCCISVLVSSFL